MFTTEPADYIKMVSDPELGDELRACLEPLRFNYLQGDPNLITGQVKSQDVPIDVAFEVIARAEGRETPIGRLVLRRGGKPSVHHHGFAWRHDGPAIESFDLILRSSETLVRESVDLFGSWQGELIFKDVPISVHPNATGK